MTSLNEAVEQVVAGSDERPVRLSALRGPADLRLMTATELVALAGEIREFLVEHVSAVGGHLGPNLGVVELTLALHRVFDSPTDPIVFDTGHQAYVHKIVTGRHDRFATLRQYGGLSGYPSRAESEHDLVENSHASTSLAYADGMAKAFELRGETARSVVAVIGDGSLTGGMCWEALNNIGVSQRPVVIVLNDNGRSYEPTVGVLAEHLADLRADNPIAGGLTLFDNLGLLYLGPVDGHDIVALERTLAAAKTLARPVLVHVVTQKGRGYRPAEAHEADRMHGIGVIDPATGVATGPSKPSWTGVFEKEIAAIARRRPDVVGITAAMKHPVGFGRFAAEFPDRVFDVGMAEQHAVTSAAGLAMGGTHPVVAVYATFLNRAFDQVLMDVGLHGLPVTFVLDRAGITGPDGASHHGMWDLSLLSMVPGMRVACPRDATRLRDLLGEAVEVADGPTAIRFPKASVGADLPAVDRVGRADVLFPGGRDILLVAVGTTAPMCVAAAEQLVARGLGVTVVDPRWVLPVEPDLVRYAGDFSLACVVEDGVRVGGVGSAVTQACADAGVRTPVWSFGLPRRFLPCGSPAEVGRDCGLTADDIVASILGPGRVL